MQEWTSGKNAVYKTIGASNHTDEPREKDDYYATDPRAINKLFLAEVPNTVHVWEPACGGGHLSEMLRYYGYEVFSSDIVDRGYENHDQTLDFLKTKTPPFRARFNIITNPPYKHAKEFVLKALELLPQGCKCFMFLKLTFLEGKARLEELFYKFPPKAVHVLSERLQCAKNGDFDKYKNGAVAYAWFVWQKGYAGKTVIDWI